MRWIGVAVLGVALAAAPPAAAGTLSKQDALAAIQRVAIDNLTDDLAASYRTDWCRHDGRRFSCRVRAFGVRYRSNETGEFSYEDEAYRPIVYRDRDGDVMVRSSGLCGYGLSPCLGIEAADHGPRHLTP